MSVLDLDYKNFNPSLIALGDPTRAGIDADSLKEMPGLDELDDLYVPDNIKYIWEWAMLKWKVMKLSLPRDITIRHESFKDCHHLEKVEFRGRTYMYDQGGQFENCENLEEISIHLNGGNIPKYAFSGCRNLKKVNILFGECIPAQFRMDTYAFNGIAPDAEINIYFVGNKYNEIRICNQGLDHPVKLTFFGVDKSKILAYYSSNWDLSHFVISRTQCDDEMKFKELVGWK